MEWGMAADKRIECQFPAFGISGACFSKGGTMKAADYGLGA